MKATPSALMAAPKTVSHTTMRHRRDGSRPLGNKSIRNTARVGLANHIHVENQAAKLAPGQGNSLQQGMVGVRCSETPRYVDQSQATEDPADRVGR